MTDATSARRFPLALGGAALVLLVRLRQPEKANEAGDQLASRSAGGL